MLFGVVHISMLVVAVACSFRLGERNRKPPGAESKRRFPPDPRPYHTFAVSGCIMDVSVAQDCFDFHLRAEAIHRKVDVRHFHSLRCSRRS